MRFTKPFLLSGLLAAAIIGGLVLYGMNRRLPVPPPPVPNEPVPEAVEHPPKTYMNTSIGFTVEYPVVLVPTEDRQQMAASGYLPVCDPETAVVCFPYAKSLFPGTDFEGAAFSVHALPKLKTAAKCDIVGNGERADGSVVMGGLTYKKFAFGDAAMGHRLSGENYRLFRKGACIQLTTAIFTSAFENYPSGTLERFKDTDRRAIQDILDGMLGSFRFTEDAALR